jgi:hypothetical protein
MVEHICPTAERMSANLLRMCIAFSAPISLGHSARHFRIVDKEVRA